MKKIKLGTKVIDKITGFTGIATTRVEYINGCIQCCITPRMSEDGVAPKGEYFDEKMVEIIDEQELNIKMLRTGGPQRDCPKW